MLVPLAVVAPLVALGAAQYSVSASFEPPAKRGANGAVAVTFFSLDPDLRLNEQPAPRLALEPGQKLLVDRQPPAPSRVEPYDPDTASYIDTRAPVLFPVAWAAGAPKGPHVVRASVTYFYCSKREGWCKRGVAELEVPVKVP